MLSEKESFDKFLFPEHYYIYVYIIESSMAEVSLQIGKQILICPHDRY